MRCGIQFQQKYMFHFINGTDYLPGRKRSPYSQLIEKLQRNYILQCFKILESLETCL